MKTKLTRSNQHSNQGFSAIMVVLIIGAVGSAIGGFMMHRASQGFQALEIKAGQDQAYSRINSGINVVAALIKGRSLIAANSPSLVAVSLTPVPISDPSACNPAPTTSPAMDTPLWRFIPRSGATPAKIAIAPCTNCRVQDEQLEFSFDSTNAALTDASFQGINGTFHYSAKLRSGRRISANYQTTMQVPKPPTPSVTNKCALIIDTRGSHHTNDAASLLGGFPNWGNTYPNYRYWRLYIPVPSYLYSSIGANPSTGTYPNDNFPHHIYENMVDGGDFAPCNRSARWPTCLSEYRAPPLYANICGVSTQVFTNHVPGSGTCTANCQCYLGRPPTSPLVVDFADKGVKFSASLEEFVKFDMGAGDHINTAWIANGADVGFVAYDKNGNGKIDSVHELFGDRTIGPDGASADQGFEALGKYDANKDSKIDASDPIFADLLIWFDKNADGKTDPGELQKLSDTGIAAIDLNFVAERTQADENGNESKYTGQARLTDGKVLTVYDVYFDGFAKLYASETSSIEERRIKREHVTFEVN